MARRHLQGVIAGWPEPQREAALLATSELVSNAVLHGLTGQASSADNGQHLLLSTKLDSHALRVEVTDLNDTPPHSSSPPADSEGGRGLHIVTELVTAWGALPPRPGLGKTVWSQLDI